ncbi:type II secretion system F family protein [Catellatospora sichuanensis]|uniref:type II secretion system F family protein n=1 Tax=Catellatospora sichuanensis TaxID=1969805 RepID=UPI0011829725|nr:type II secretion system F family protein [Catellatospora sichuanensis]
MIGGNLWLALGITGGAIAGLGVYLLVMLFVPATPALGPALRRLHPGVDPHYAALADLPVVDGDWLSKLRLPMADLAILDKTPERHVTSVVVSGLLGLALPVVVTVVLVATGRSLPVVVPVALTLVLALGMGALAHYDMLAKAKSARAEFVRALCTYATLTAHQVRSGHGAVEAMERSARICDGWPYVRLRTALLSAQLQMRAPWDELKGLASTIGVVELTSFADIMRSAGNDGAQVYQTLRAQAASLRDQIRVRALETAKTRTSKLDIPSTMMIMILLILVGYPLMVSLFNQR